MAALYNGGVSTEPVSDEPIRSAGRGAWLALLAAALLVRGGVLWRGAEFSGRDADAYRQLAAELHATGQYALDGQPTALRPPLYPLLLAAAMGRNPQSDIPIAALHLALGAVTVLATWGAARRYGMGRGASVAAALVLVDPILVNQSRLVMSETAAACCAALCLWSLGAYFQRRSAAWAVASGASLGLAAVCRPEFFPFALLVAVTLFLNAAKHSERGLHVRHALALLLVAAAPVAAWTVRNVVALGRPVPLTTHGGYTLLLANNDFFYDYLRSDDTRLPWDSATFERQLAEQMSRQQTTFAEMDDECYRMAWATIRARPGDFALATWHRVARFWGVLPYPRSLEESGRERTVRHAIAAWYLAQYAAVLVGLWKLAGRALSLPWVWAILLILCFAGVHLLYWSDMRMRSAAAPALALLATAALARPVRPGGAA